MPEAIGTALVDAFYVSGSLEALAAGEFLITYATTINTMAFPCVKGPHQLRQRSEPAQHSEGAGQ